MFYWVHFKCVFKVFYARSSTRRLNLKKVVLLLQILNHEICNFETIFASTSLARSWCNIFWEKLNVRENCWIWSFGTLLLIWKPGHSKSGLNCPDLKWWTQNGGSFGRFSNGWATRFQIPFKIQTVCKPTSFWPSKTWTSPNFRSPLISIQNERHRQNNFQALTRANHWAMTTWWDEQV